MKYDVVRLCTGVLLPVVLSAAAIVPASLLSASTARAQSQDLPPAAAETRDTGRIFLDGRVSDVYVDNFKTIVIMAQAPQSNCPSNQYVYERDRPKWLYETGRLLVAAEEQADIRISFTCYSGLQSINALQFLSPATRRMVAGTPGQGRIVPNSANPQGIVIPASRTPGTRQPTRAPDASATATSRADVGLVVRPGTGIAPPPAVEGPAPNPLPSGGAAQSGAFPQTPQGMAAPPAGTRPSGGIPSAGMLPPPGSTLSGSGQALPLPN